jgi:hypothetical protein
MSATNPEAFVRLPIWWIELVEKAGLDAAHLGLLAVLSSYARQDKTTCFPSQSTLADRVGRSRAWVNAALAKICDLGIIEKRSRFRADQGRSSNLYTIRFQQDQSAGQQDQSAADNLVSEEMTGGVKDIDMKQNKDKSTHSDGGINEWKVQPEMLREMEKKIGLEGAKLYVQRFILRCKRQYHYRVEELDLALRQWFNDDVERLMEKRAKGSSTSAQPKSRTGWNKQPGPLPVRPDDRVQVSASNRPDDIDLPDEIWAAAGRVERGERLPDAMPDQVRFRAALASLLASKGRSVYDQWLAKLDFAGVQNGNAVIRAQTSFKADYVRQTFGDDMARAFRKAGLRFDGLNVMA